MTDTYQIRDGAGNDMDGEDFTANADCNDTAGLPWNGRFIGDSPWWPATNGSIGNPRKVKGTSTALFLADGVYYLSLYCCNDYACVIPVWAGTKTGGSSPAGTYTQTGGVYILASIDVYAV